MTNWMSGLSKANGILLHYLRTGGCRPPLILLHGLTGSGACWTPLARALEGDYDIVMPDARGHGNSATPPNGYLYEDLAGDVVGLIQGLGLVAPVVLGHSMGGMTAAVVASCMGTELRGVILADPTFLRPKRQREVYESDVAGQHRRLLCLKRGDVLAELQLRHPHRSREIVELLAEARLQTRIEAFEILKPPNPEYRDLVRRIQAPVLLLIAENGLVSAETAAELQELNSRLRVERVHDAGHAIPYDQPDRFREAVRSFLGSLEAC